jgi:hypothetical protein
MMEIIKKYTVHFALGLLTVGAGWVATINSRIFNSTEQKVKVVDFVEESPSALDQWRGHLSDSINNADAIKTRAARFKLAKESDSVRRVHDSLFLDQVRRQTVQIEQMKVKIDEIH